MKKSDFKSRLKEGMKARNIKAIDLANKLNINRAIISQYLNGRYLPNHSRIFEISSALNVNEAWLLGFDVPMELHDGIITPREFMNEVLVLLSKTSNLSDKEKNKIISEIKYICEDE